MQIACLLLALENKKHIHPPPRCEGVLWGHIFHKVTGGQILPRKLNAGFCLLTYVKKLSISFSTAHAHSTEIVSLVMCLIILCALMQDCFE